MQRSKDRPTNKTSDHRSGFPKDWSGRHWSLWIGTGEVAYQVQARLWRLTVGFTWWRAYDL